MCDGVVPGIIEILAVSILIGALSFIKTIFGLCFVIRNKIDVPKNKQLKSQEEKYK
jgi:hypothetical protein